jgi:RHS repeat-associated protein
LNENGNLLRTYIWGTGIDNLLSMTVYGTAETNTYYAIKDHQNTVIALVDETGADVESYEYDAWGNPRIFDASGSEILNGTSQIGNRYTFQGREIDWETGLIYFRARWYNPETGRWLSKDPIGIAGGLNLYAFCGNNPVNFTDPDGLWKRGGYDCADDAARGFFDEARGRGIDGPGGNEWGSRIRQNKYTGKWSYTKPTEGDPMWPADKDRTGIELDLWENETSVHTHPGGTKEFSPKDREDKQGQYMLPYGEKGRYCGLSPFFMTPVM